MRRQKKENVEKFYININLMFKFIQAYKSNVERAKKKKQINTDQQSTPHFQFAFLFSGPPVNYRLQSASSVRPKVVIFRANTSLALTVSYSLTHLICLSFRPKFKENVAGHHTRNDKCVSLVCAISSVCGYIFGTDILG